MDLGLAGRRAIVTGATKGIGLAVARELLAEGARVAICARNADEVGARAKELRSLGEVLGLAADVSSATAVAEFMERSAEWLGGLDILVNNAGRAQPGGFATLTDDALLADLQVKLFSQVRCSREALPLMRRAGGGAIVNVNAIFGRQADPAFFATTVNRAACLAFTKTLAIEAAADRVLVNSVNIGFVRTPQWERIHAARAPELSIDAFLGQLAGAEVPLGRFGTAEEVSGLVAFLVSPRASYITGASIDVAGGMGKYI